MILCYLTQRLVCKDRKLFSKIQIVKQLNTGNISRKHTLNFTKVFKKSSTLERSKLLKMKIDIPEFHALFTPELKKLVGLFEKYEYEMRIAGGAVRDLLNNKQPHDIDFATIATPEQMKELFDKEEIRMINAKGEKHGTITARINDKENFEVTTLRIDIRTDGRHAEVQWTKDWQLDALRRDLTINSMFLGFDGTVYDYFNGISDLKAKKVRFVGNGADRIQEDYLRILRYFRFYGRISIEPDTHEDHTMQAIKENMDGLKIISGERIWMEIKKILTGNHAGSLVVRMLELGMAKYIGLPEELNTEEFKLVCELCQDLNPEPMTLLTALLSTEEQVYELNNRLKISRDELRTGIFIINYRNTDLGDDPFRTCQDIYCDTSGKEVKTQQKLIELLKYKNKRDALTELSKWTPPKFPLNGLRLIQAGCQKGPALAKMLNEFRELWKKSGFVLTEDQLMDSFDEVKQKLKL